MRPPEFAARARRAGVVLTLVALCCGIPPAFAASRQVHVIRVESVISSSAAEYIVAAIKQAEKDKVAALVIELDTPGGLDTSMRAIIKDILASPVPVAAFVAPGGARAASAGTYILYASHVAAMAPATNLGAATPVAIGAPSGGGNDGDGKKEDNKAGKRDAGDLSSTMTRKQVNDAAAYIRGLAQMRGRNSAWGERAVREAVSLSAGEALKSKVIDLVAEDVPSLLRQLDGRRLEVPGGERVLQTAGVAAMASSTRGVKSVG